jgi:nitrate reductase delta subunit
VSLLSRRRAAAVQERPGPERRPGPGQLMDRQTRLVWRITGLLLDYPGEKTLAMLPSLAAEAAALPAPAGPALRRVCAHLAAGNPTELAKTYVETFDLRRRHCLHLTYFAYGDTRKRGMALLRLKHAYKEAGGELREPPAGEEADETCARELPDHLPLLLEFAATVDPVTGRRLLMEYRPVLELLRRALHEAGSEYGDLLDALGATLPELAPAELRRVAELAAQGPPGEDVGLEPYGMDPSVAERLGGAAGPEGIDTMGARR